MVLVFYKPSRRKRRAAGEDSAGHGGAVCVVVLPDQVLVLAAPVTKEGLVLEEEGCGFALWGGDAGDGRDLPDVETFLNRIKRIRPADAYVIPVTDWRSGKQTGVAARDERGGYDVRIFEGRMSGAVRGAAIDTAIDNATRALLDAVIPGSGRPSLETVISELEKLLKPREILLALVNAAARTIAIHAGLPIVIATLTGQFAKNTVSGLLSPEDATDHPTAARLLKGAKIAAYAEGGTLAKGITDLFLTPAIKSGLRNATAPICRARPVDTQRASDDGVAAQPGPSSAGILKATRKWDSPTILDPPDDGPASAAPPAVSPR